MQKTRKYKFKNKQTWANPHAGWWLNRHPSGSRDLTWTHCANNCWMHFTETANAGSKCNVGCLLVWWYRIVKNVSKNNSSSLEWGVGLYFRRFFLRPNFSRWKKNVSAKREHLRTVRNKDKLSLLRSLWHALNRHFLLLLYTSLPPGPSRLAWVLRVLWSSNKWFVARNCRRKYTLLSQPIIHSLC